jgi:hypothetical protein
MNHILEAFRNTFLCCKRLFGHSHNAIVVSLFLCNSNSLNKEPLSYNDDLDGITRLLLCGFTLFFHYKHVFCFCNKSPEDVRGFPIQGYH